MRAVIGLSVALLVVFAGCSAPFASSEGAVEPTGVDSTDSGATSATPPEPTGDRLGWENGYWYNESIAVDDTAGLNESERRAVVARTMARIEIVRKLEYTKPVSVDVIARDEFRNQYSLGTMLPTSRTFDNAKFEAMFLVGEDRNSLAVQDRNRGSSVQGYYAPGNDSIVVVSKASNPRLSASTLAHELTHALQDQQFNLTDNAPPTREAYNARNGLVEGEANFVQRRYEQRFEDGWESTAQGGNGRIGGGASSSQLHFGIYFLEFFPYSDGPGFVASLYEQGGWEAVNAAHRNLPASTEQVIYPRLYEQDAPQNVTVRDTSSRAWERVRPGSARRGQQRPGYAVLGQSALSSTFAYTLFDARSGMTYNNSALVRPEQVINRGERGQGANSSDPLNYDLPATRGWDGDKMYVYQNDQGETGYVWKLAWDSPAEAQQFAAAYENLLSHWGGDQLSESTTASVWVIEGASPFTDAFRVEVSGDTVTITNAPRADAIDGVHGGLNAGPPEST